GRTLAGLSAGGYGAVDIGLRHPLVFGRLESWGGYFSPRADLPVGDPRPLTAAAHDPPLLARREAQRPRPRAPRLLPPAGPRHRPGRRARHRPLRARAARPPSAVPSGAVPHRPRRLEAAARRGTPLGAHTRKPVTISSGRGGPDGPYKLRRSRLGECLQHVG